MHFPWETPAPTWNSSQQGGIERAMKMRNVVGQMRLQLRNHENTAFAHTRLCHDSTVRLPASIQGERYGSLPTEKLFFRREGPKNQQRLKDEIF